ncbi:MAG TPA: gluconate 2-dehydrogenase subunit 3 family protein [Burkholderiales bacterium]|jgi:gluconate 2-dehydrogenase gamma chain|nr:gluconate 2-dehydrogenase subunit 3 family protein [Burkholderiales bacterium]
MAESEVLHAYGYLTGPEVRFLEAAAERLIPTDELGPGGKDAGVACYIDGQLRSAWGTHGRNYRSGPWLEGTPEQGFQSRLTPQEIYRIGIQEINAACRAQYEKPFDQLQPERQDEVLKALEKGEFKLPSLSSKLFFDLLWRNTEEGYFADPMYGGNRGKVGWKLVGFPGVPSGAYKDHLDKSELYRAEPVSILDIQMKQAQVDAQGYAKHIMLKQEGRK